MNGDVSNNPQDVQVTTIAEQQNSLPSIKELLQLSWNRFKERLWRLTFFTAVPIVATFVIALVAVMSMFIVAKHNPYFSIQYLMNNNGVPTPLGALVVLSFGLLIIIISSWSTLALTFQAVSSVPLSIKETIIKSRNRLLSFWWLALLIGIIELGSFVFLVIPGVIFTVFFMFWLYTFVVEEEKGMNALLKSREYVRGYWWKAFRYGAVLVIIGIILNIIINPIRKVVPQLGNILHLAEQILYPAFSATYMAILFSRFKALKPSLLFTPQRSHKVGYLVIGILGVILVSYVSIMIALFLNAHPELRMLLQASKFRSM